MPKVVTANRLNDGAVVYLRANGDWSADLGSAAIANDADALAALEARGAAAEAARCVVAVYSMDVQLLDGRPIAASVREVIRAEQAAQAA